MTEHIKEWVELREKVTGKPTNRKLVERTLANFYKWMGWKPFDYIIYAADPVQSWSRGYRRRGQPGRRQDHRSDPDAWQHGYEYIRGVGAINRVDEVYKRFTVSRSAVMIDGTVTRIPWSDVAGSWGLVCGAPHRRALYAKLKPLASEILEIIPSERTPIVIEKPLEAHKNIDGRVHCSTGPAITWRSGAREYWWNGVRCSKRFVEGPVTLGYIKRERNAERKRILIERFGEGNYLKAINAVAVSTDRYGTLWRVHRSVDLDTNGNFTDRSEQFVELTNSTPEPDGTFNKYFIRVPPDVGSAHEAVAWTFNLRVYEYDPLEET